MALAALKSLPRPLRPRSPSRRTASPKSSLLPQPPPPRLLPHSSKRHFFSSLFLFCFSFFFFEEAAVPPLTYWVSRGTEAPARTPLRAPLSRVRVSRAGQVAGSPPAPRGAVGMSGCP